MQKKLTVNIPLTEALEKILGIKIMKNLVSKIKMVSFDSTNNVHPCRVIGSSSLFDKKKGVGVFMIPCPIGCF